MVAASKDDACPPGGALLRILADLAERTAEVRSIATGAKDDATRAQERLDELVLPSAVAGRENRLSSIEARLTALERMDGRWLGVLRWIVDRIMLPLAALAAGALAARRGWLP